MRKGATTNYGYKKKLSNFASKFEKKKIRNKFHAVVFFNVYIIIYHEEYRKRRLISTQIHIFFIMRGCNYMIFQS